MLGGCIALPFSLLKTRHDGVVIQIENEIIKAHKLGKKITLQELGKRVERSNK